MKINNYIKNKSIYFGISLFIIVVLSISSSFAFMNSKVDDTVVEDNLKVTYKEEILDYLNKTNTITISNIGTKKEHFSLYVKNEDSTNSLDLNKISYSINDGIESTLKKGNIYSGYLNQGEEITLKVNLWIEVGNLDNSDQGKSIQINFDVK